MNEKQLIDLKKQIEVTKSSVSEMKGQRTALLNQLKKDFNCKSVEEGQAKLEELETVLESTDKKIKKGLQEIEENYNL